MSVTAITLVCNPDEPTLDETAAKVVLSRLSEFGRVERRTLNQGVAEDFILAANASRDEVETAIGDLAENADIFVQPAPFRRKRLIIADMDSTIIGQECIDELAAYAGKKLEISEITERAMRGELDFESALVERVSRLKGLTENVLEECYRSRITLNPGAQTLIATLNSFGAKTVLVSGGFNFFVRRVAEECGFHNFRANDLEYLDGMLSGKVRGPILGRAAKRDTLLEFAHKFNVPLEFTQAIGDGANDLEMIETSGFGVAYYAKPKVTAVADASITKSDLTALLYAQGITRAEFV